VHSAGQRAGDRAEMMSANDLIHQLKWVAKGFAAPSCTPLRRVVTEGGVADANAFDPHIGRIIACIELSR